MTDHTQRRTIQRIERIESILRDYGMHEPDCPKRESQRAQMQTGAYVTPLPCQCWLDFPTALDQPLSDVGDGT